MKSCSANALASACEYILQRQTSRYMPVSRIFIYFNGRVIQQGICREAIWPYKEYLLNQKPSELVYTEAKQYIVNVSALPLNVNLIKKSLVDGIHVAAVIKMKNGSHQSATSMNGYISMPSSDGTIFNRVYAYAVLIVGYDDDTKYFIVRNSWGKEWGIGGYFFLPYRCLTLRDLTDRSRCVWTVTSIKQRIDPLSALRHSPSPYNYR